MTCKDCVHYEKCKPLRLDFANSVIPNHTCQHFKNKADFVEVKRGEWIVDRDCTSVTYRCPICKFELTLADPEEKLEYKGCPMCLSMLKEGVE